MPPLDGWAEALCGKCTEWGVRLKLKTRMRKRSAPCMHDEAPYLKARAAVRSMPMCNMKQGTARMALRIMMPARCMKDVMGGSACRGSCIKDNAGLVK